MDGCADFSFMVECCMMLPKKLAFCSVLMAVMAMPAMADDSVSAAMLDGVEFNNKEFNKNRTQAIRKLQERGYQVRSIQLKSHGETPVFVIHATKNGMRYVIKLTYADLKIIQETRLDAV